MDTICIKRRYYFDRYAYKHIHAKVAAPLLGIGSCTVEYLRCRIGTCARAREANAPLECRASAIRHFYLVIAGLL